MSNVWQPTTLVIAHNANKATSKSQNKHLNLNYCCLNKVQVCTGVNLDDHNSSFLCDTIGSRFNAPSALPLLLWAIYHPLLQSSLQWYWMKQLYKWQFICKNHSPNFTCGMLIVWRDGPFISSDLRSWPRVFTSIGWVITEAKWPLSQQSRLMQLLNVETFTGEMITRNVS